MRDDGAAVVSRAVLVLAIVFLAAVMVYSVVSMKHEFERRIPIAGAVFRSR
ncbi:hypothetical protein HKCCE3408_16165 [Rhodobacterales bacterium HKCCE3408]|nr:hypothetical protein [Rhodobacterales bacterium HKCCE3408]